MERAQDAPGLVAPPAALATRLAPWVAALPRDCGDRFRALYLHGSALTPRFDAQASDLNLLLVVAELPFDLLSTLARSVRALVSHGQTGRRTAPLVLTEAQIRSSIDVFPAEFLDLSRGRSLLAGEDVLGGLAVGLGNLRHQCEYELRSKLVGLRQAYLGAGDVPDAAQRLLVQAAGGLAAVLRQLLVLRSSDPPDDPQELVSAVARAYAVDGAALGAPFAARASVNVPSTQADAAFAAHVRVLESLIQVVDAHSNP